MENGRPSDRIFEQIATMEIGDVLTYPDLEQLLGKKLTGGRGPIYTAIRRAEKECLRSLDCVPQLGYRMVEAREHETLGRRHHARSVKQMRRSWQRLHSADRALLSREERDRIDRLEATVARQQQAIRSLEERQQRTESILDAVREQSTQTAEVSGEMGERISRMEEALALLVGRG